MKNWLYKYITEPTFSSFESLFLSMALVTFFTDLSFYSFSVAFFIVLVGGFVVAITDYFKRMK